MGSWRVLITSTSPDLGVTLDREPRFFQYVNLVIWSCYLSASSASSGISLSRHSHEAVVVLHSFRLFLLHLFKSTTTQRCSRHSTDTVCEFHAEVPEATVSEGLAQGPYVEVRAGVEPMTLRTKGVESTNESQRPCIVLYSSIYIVPLNSHGQTEALLVLLAPRKETSFKKW